MKKTIKKWIKITLSASLVTSAFPVVSSCIFDNSKEIKNFEKRSNLPMKEISFFRKNFDLFYAQ
ncbi:hypothetical protein [Mycoplasmopsis gallopavonis]|uniref:Lipoprotein n=1 Tax=Mycoplasmopsis gallopavonis TaxID=76629 RepID=A0A449AYT9_9BACT|nr:hypothetical protein [Mycoplasmopsis gallopavonis]RIV16872.1 hypothetical protein D1113_00605 [Mycoplasmopsis gallopavonis]VEU72670.1 Uncharacterised protein [Mycoplasmopsis gallopavonis]